MKLYQVIIQDEYNNLFNMGFYKELKESIKDINNFLESYDINISEDLLKEYPSSFNSCFDLDLSTIYEDEIEPIMIRGFIFDFDEKIINELIKKQI